MNAKVELQGFNCKADRVTKLIFGTIKFPENVTTSSSLALIYCARRIFHSRPVNLTEINMAFLIVESAASILSLLSILKS